MRLAHSIPEELPRISAASNDEFQIDETDESIRVGRVKSDSAARYYPSQRRQKTASFLDYIKTTVVVAAGLAVGLSATYYLYTQVKQHSPDVFAGLSAIGVATAGETPATAQLTAESFYATYRSDTISVTTNKPDNLFVEGERLMVNLRSDAFAINFVYVDYYAMDGSVTHLFSSKSSFDHTANQLMIGEEMWLGEPGDVERWDISAPFGTEYIGVIVASRDLNIESSAEVELAQTYLQRIQRETDATSVQVFTKLVPINTVATQL